MYSVTLILHNVLRWVVLLAGVIAAFRAVSGWLGARPWTRSSTGPGRVFTIAFDIQLVVGILLYAVLSPVTQQAFADMAAAMRVPEMRFFVAEHALLMVLALVCAHLGTATAPRGGTDAIRYRRAAMWYTASVLLVLAGMPWWRPLLRLS